MGRQVHELRKLSDWQFEPRIEWTCYEPIGTNFATLKTDFSNDNNVRCVETLAGLAEKSFDFCILSNVLHELTPSECCEFLMAADHLVDHDHGGIIILELFPLLRPEAKAVPYDPTTLEELLFCAGFAASSVQLGVRAEVNAYCILARRRDPHSSMDKAIALTCIEQAWERLFQRAISEYSIGVSRDAIAEHLRVLLEFPGFSGDYSGVVYERLRIALDLSAEMAVTTRSIVEDINVVGHIGNRHHAVLVDLFLNSLFLQASEKGFCDGIVPAVAFSTHARLKVIRTAESSPSVAAKLGTLIGMNQRAARSSLAHRHQHRIQHELAVDRGRGRPPHDHA